jgi:predicted GNAT superfamily acetyltransferase
MKQPAVLRNLETPAEMQAVEDLQRSVWTGNETEIVPVHMLIAAIHSGGLAIGAFAQGEQGEQLVGFVFGFPGFYETPDGPRLKHHSHMLGVHPDYRDGGLGFLLKRAQWQMVRHQGLDRITWTYDPLLSRNAHLNISRLGSVCNTYMQNIYGELRDGMNAGLPSDRFMVDWWVHSMRVEHRLSRHARQPLDLAHYLAAGAPLLNPAAMDPRGLVVPAGLDPQALPGLIADPTAEHTQVPLVLVEIPANFLALKAADAALGLEWRLHTRTLFETLFGMGYLVTDFIHLPGDPPRSFYVLSDGESTL